MFANLEADQKHAMRDRAFATVDPLGLDNSSHIAT
jgi:hypothetical protein